MEERAKARAERKSLLDARKKAAEEEKLVSLNKHAVSQWLSLIALEICYQSGNLMQDIESFVRNLLRNN